MTCPKHPTWFSAKPCLFCWWAEITKRGRVVIATAAVLAAFLVLLPRPAQAETWDSFRASHATWIERGEPAKPYLGALTSDWLAARAEWTATVRLRTARWFHRFQSLPAPLPASNTSYGVLTWENADAVADCEASGKWDINNGNGFWGGLQFYPSTWFAWGGGPFDGVGPFPYSREEQISVAVGHSLSNWPVCGVGK